MCILSVLMVLVVLVVGGSLCQELTSKNILNTRADLSWTKSYLSPTNVMNLLGNSNLKNNTFFAPNNLAYTRLSRFFRNQLNGTQTKTMEDFFHYHLMYEVWSPRLMNGRDKMKLTTAYKTSYLFVNKIKDKIFVNNAELTNADLMALNGRVHVIDRIFVHKGPILDVSHGLNAYDYLEEEKSNMHQIFKTYHDNTISGTISPDSKFDSAVKDYIGNADSFCTLFVPDNKFIHKFQTKEQDMFSKLSGLSPGLMKSVVNSLVIPNFAYHVRVLLYLSTNQMPVNAIKGNIKTYELNNEVYVVNECGQARITKSDIVTNNCIIHYVDSFLGLISNNTFFTILSMYDLSEFHRTIYSLPPDLKDLLKTIGGFESNVNQSNKYTIFAPTNGVFGKVDFARDEATKRKQLQMIMVKGVLDLTQITEPIKVETLRSGYYATIRKVGHDIFVAVDHVEAKVVVANICTFNGLVHKVDRILGLPDTNIQEYLDEKQYRKMSNILENTGLLTSLINPTNRITLFTVNESAIDKLNPMFLGQQNKNKLRDLTARHMGNTVLFLDTIPEGESFQYETYNGEVTVSNENGVFWVSADGERVRVLKADMKMNNGVIHIVSRFLPYQISSVVTTNSLIFSKTIYFLLSAFNVFHLSF